MTHAFSASLEQSRGILKVRAQEEADVYVRRKRIEIAEGRFADARGGMPVMEQLAHVLAAQGSGNDDSVPVLHVSQRQSGEDRRSLLAGELAGRTAVQISSVRFP